MCTLVYRYIFLIWFLVTDEFIESCCTENYSLKIFNGNSRTKFSNHLLFLNNDKVWELQVSSHLIILCINARFQFQVYKVQIKLLTQGLCVLQSLTTKVIISIQIDVTYCKIDILWGDFLASGIFFSFSFPTQETTVAAINNLLSHHFFMDWIQSEFFYYSQVECGSPSKIMSSLEK